MSLSDREALLAAIISQPEEDTPRLMFADWLKENGEPDRGEFIRLQVEAAMAEPFSPQARTLGAAAQKLLKRYDDLWTRRIAERVERDGYQFARGFVDHVTVNAATFARDAVTLFAAEPIRSLRVLRFAYAAPPAPLDAIFNLPQMTRVTRLDFSKLRQHPDYFDAFAEVCPRLSQLTDLNLSDNPVPVAWLRTLLTGPALPALAGLDLADNSNLSRVLAEALPGASHRRFTRLDLSRIPFPSELLQRALASRCVRELEELRFAWSGGVAGVGPLTHVTLGWTIPWDNLRVLDINGQGVGDEGVRSLVAGLGRRPGFAPLRWLGLANNGLKGDAIRALLGSDDKRLKLYHLDVRNNNLSAGHRAALRERFPEAEVLG